MSQKIYPHGTRARYSLNGCRCADCDAARRVYDRELKDRIEPAYIAAGPARTHVRELMDAGVGLKRIAKVSGVSHGALWKLIYGKRTKNGDQIPSKRIRKTTADKLLAVTPADAADGASIDATATWVLIDEMVASGVRKVRIAEHLGQTAPGLQLARNTVTARNARAVADLHRRWRSGEIELAHHDRWGNTRVAVPPPAERGQADISDLLVELAEIIEERNEQPWRAEAACRARPTYLWFPARGDTPTTQKAMQICKSCFVRDQCRAANLDQRDGIYGALSSKARRELRTADTIAPPARVVVHGTNAGYHHHVRAGETACTDCLRAHAHYMQDNRPSRRGAA
jgi:hypothetical protein